MCNSFGRRRDRFKPLCVSASLWLSVYDVTDDAGGFALTLTLVEHKLAADSRGSLG
jgi:hypothetical protein